MSKRLARVHLIYKNPRYKVVQKDNKYLLIDLEQYWYSFLFPMLYWIIPIKYTEITYSEYNSLNTFPSKKHYGNSILAGGIAVIISVFLRKFIILIDIPIMSIYMFVIYFVGLITIIYIRITLSRKLKISEFDMRDKKNLRLYPTFKNLFIVLFEYIFFLPVPFITYSAMFANNLNIIFYICWLIVAFLLSVINFSTISDRKVYVKLQN